MNINEIEEMARTAGFETVDSRLLERFANLVAAAEREACARVCDEEKLEACWHEDAHTVAAYLASVIRARGEE